MNLDDLKLKLAWQAAFELRTCPDLALLRVAQADRHLERHLAVCPSCRETRALPEAELAAWGVVREQFLSLAGKGAVPEKTAGQVWLLDSSLAGWTEDHSFLRPPAVLLLERTPVGSGWRVAQIYSDRALMWHGDVALSERFGFAQAWNCYTIKESLLSNCLGVATEGELRAVEAAAAVDHEPAQRDSPIAFFRQLEVQVGAQISLPAVLDLAAEYERLAPPSHSEICQRIFGSVGLAVQALKGWGWSVPEVSRLKGFAPFHTPEESLVESLFGLLAAASPPSGQAPMSAAGTAHTLPVNHVRSARERALGVEPLLARINLEQWQGDGYLVSGDLASPFDHAVQVLASLRREDGTQLETRYLLKPGAANFLLFFEGAEEGESSLERVQMLLVSHE
ncbi:hypothetical protein GMLC_10610 [Geomonas limicola]|uniref:Uncharacterized protein n=2 Tax=Geomonas limicola TaxID=2740186 RepID=A0A6V8N4J3_9BACT|nr:hypothetical protein GMLC_10610 [Geomonas limicola]